MADPGPVPRCVCSPHLNSQPSHCSAFYPENPGSMSTQAEGNWETKKPPRNWEAEKLEIARHFEMGLFTKKARQCNDMRGMAPPWSHPSRLPPSFQGQKNWDFACLLWLKIGIASPLLYLLPLWSHSFPPFIFFHLKSSFHQYVLRHICQILL